MIFIFYGLWGLIPQLQKGMFNI